MLTRIRRLFAHRNHANCSLYAPCRKEDLRADWQRFQIEITGSPQAAQTFIDGYLAARRFHRDN